MMSTAEHPGLTVLKSLVFQRSTRMRSFYELLTGKWMPEVHLFNVGCQSEKAEVSSGYGTQPKKQKNITNVEAAAW